ncbi:transposable element Tc1 transposase [Trichonephila clavipes]|nr:transposable element Tc1 transposase [Trichonephila clavipes]
MAGYHSRLVRKKPYISMTNRLKRIAFENDHIHKPLEFWRTVIFSDEGKFCIFDIKGCKLVWRKPCTALQKEHLVPTVKHGGGGFIFWGCMVSNDVGKLEYI